MYRIKCVLIIMHLTLVSKPFFTAWRWHFLCMNWLEIELKKSTVECTVMTWTLCSLVFIEEILSFCPLIVEQHRHALNGKLNIIEVIWWSRFFAGRRLGHSLAANGNLAKLPKVQDTSSESILPTLSPWLSKIVLRNKHFCWHTTFDRDLETQPTVIQSHG